MLHQHFCDEYLGDIDMHSGTGTEHQPATAA
jgi:hypothetical protein